MRTGLIPILLVVRLGAVLADRVDISGNPADIAGTQADISSTRTDIEYIRTDLAPVAEPSPGFWSQLGSLLWQATGGMLEQVVEHPADSIESFGAAIGQCLANPGLVMSDVWTQCTSSVSLLLWTALPLNADILVGVWRLLRDQRGDDSGRIRSSCCGSG